MIKTSLTFEEIGGPFDWGSYNLVKFTAILRFQNSKKDRWFDCFFEFYFNDDFCRCCKLNAQLKQWLVVGSIITRFSSDILDNEEIEECPPPLLSYQKETNKFFVLNTL